MAEQDSFEALSENEALLAIRIQHFRDVSSLFEAHLAQTVEEKSSATSKGPTEGLSVIFASIVDGVNLTYSVPNLFRRSLFVAAYSLFEHHLNLLAKDLRQERSVGLAIEDIHGQGIERARIYLKKVLGVFFPDTSNEWQEIRRLGQLRNALVHRYGTLEPAGKDKELASWIEQNELVEVFPLTKGVWLQSGFVEYTLSLIEHLFAQLGYHPEKWHE